MIILAPLSNTSRAAVAQVPGRGPRGALPACPWLMADGWLPYVPRRVRVGYLELRECRECHALSRTPGPGQIANPKGRPPGIKEAVRRGAFKAAYDRVLAKDPQLLDTVIRAGLQGQPKARNAVPFLELGAKLGKEIGADAEHDTRPVIFKFFTNLNPLALSGRVLQQQRSLPHGPEPTDGPASPSRPSRARRPGHHAERAGLPAGPAADAGE
jgi:hypothetical protein